MSCGGNHRILAWCFNVQDHAGDFLKCFGEAVARADDDNFAILLPAVVLLMAKYPEYDRPHSYLPEDKITEFE